MRRLDFFSDFNEESAKRAINFLIECRRTNEDAMFVINSSGGNFDALYPIAEVIKDSQIRLTCVGVGSVASCATALFALGDERILVPNTKFLVHYVSWENYVKHKYFYEDLIKIVENLRSRNEKFVSLYSKTGINQEIFKEHCSNGRDWLLTEEEILQYGVTTRSSEGWTNLLLS